MPFFYYRQHRDSLSQNTKILHNKNYKKIANLESKIKKSFSNYAYKRSKNESWS